MELNLEFTSIMNRGHCSFMVNKDKKTGNHSIDFEDSLFGDGSGGESIGVGRVNGEIIVSAIQYDEDEEGNDVIYSSDTAVRISFTSIDINELGFNFDGLNYNELVSENFDAVLNTVVEPILYWPNIFEKGYLISKNKNKNLFDNVINYIMEEPSNPQIVFIENIEVEEGWEDLGIVEVVLDNFFKVLRRYCYIEPLMVMGVMYHNCPQFDYMDMIGYEEFSSLLKNIGFDIFEIEGKTCFTKFTYQINETVE